MIRLLSVLPLCLALAIPGVALPHGGDDDEDSDSDRHRRRTKTTELYTPALFANTPAAAPITCTALNVGKKSVELELEIFTLGATSIAFGVCIVPKGRGCQLSTSIGAGTATYCRISTTKKARNVRGAFFWLDANGVPSGTVEAR